MWSNDNSELYEKTLKSAMHAIGLKLKNEKETNNEISL